MEPYFKELSFTKLSYCFAFLLYFLQTVLSENLIQTINDTIGAENYTYYRVSGTGRLRLELISLEGDADLYVSDTTASPTYFDYELKSTTCGIDTVEIPASFERPLGVAVYGYPSKSQTRYSLSVYFLSKYDAVDYSYLDSLYNIKDEDQKTENLNKRKPNSNHHGTQESHYSQDKDDMSVSETIWTVLLTILKVIFEIML